jgi:hypothetical protein
MSMLDFILLVWKTQNTLTNILKNSPAYKADGHLVIEWRSLLQLPVVKNQKA